MTAARSLRLSWVADPVAGRTSVGEPNAAAPAHARTEATVSTPFENLEAHAGTVYRYALRLSGRPDAAEDLTQETLLRGWKHRHALREDARCAALAAEDHTQPLVRRIAATKTTNADDRCGAYLPAEAACGNSR